MRAGNGDGRRTMRRPRSGRAQGMLCAALLGLALVVPPITLTADEQETVVANTEAAPEPVTFTEAFLNDPAHIAVGGELWAAQCRHCHGRSAYPGKAPKLKPRRYTPEFVYRRVTDGFRKMPGWKDIYSDEERMKIVAYVLSDDFSP